MLAQTLFSSNINDSLGQGPLPLTQADEVQLLPWGEALSLCQPLQFMGWLAACMPTWQTQLNNTGICDSQHITSMVTGELLSIKARLRLMQHS